MLVVLVALGSSSCGGATESRTGDGTLVLELGGNHSSLRRALMRAGVVIAPRPMGVAAESGVAPMGRILGIERPSVGPAAPPDDPPVDPAPEPDPEPAAAPSYREVELQRGETISHLASRHLGTVRRYGEILELNGWTEPQSRRLRAGTMVKIPIE